MFLVWTLRIVLVMIAILYAYIFTRKKDFGNWVVYALISAMVVFELAYLIFHFTTGLITIAAALCMALLIYIVYKRDNVFCLLPMYLFVFIGGIAILYQVAEVVVGKYLIMI